MTQIATANGRPSMGERTGAQNASDYGLYGIASTAGRMVDIFGASYNTYRMIRKDPTVALGRAMLIALITFGEWGVETDDDVDEKVQEFIQNQFLPIREPLIQTAMEGGVDFGWAPFEKVFDVETINGSQRVVLRKIKPLLQDITEIVVDSASGAFMGFSQGPDKKLPLENSLLISFRVEGTQWHGRSLLENVRGTWNKWNDADAGAARYDRKVAGSHWVIYFPPGYTDGTANRDIARQILEALESSGSVAIPQYVKEFLTNLNDAADNADAFRWNIDIKGDTGGRQPQFIDRLNYLDTLKIRGLEMPERTLLQGEHGTLAESEAHIDLATASAELTHRHITRLVNWHAVNQLLTLNFGKEMANKVRLVASPIQDDKKDLLWKVYQAVIASAAGIDEITHIDTDSIKDQLGIPKATEVTDPLGAVPPVDPNDPRAATVRRSFAAANPENA